MLGSLARAGPEAQTTLAAQGALHALLARAEDPEVDTRVSEGSAEC